MLIPLILSALLASNASGKTLVRQQPGTVIPAMASVKPIITDDANTVCHAWFKAGSIQDTRGCAWAMQGTVPQVARNGATPAGAGPCSDSNYYTAPLGSSLLDLCTGNCSLCVVYAVNPRPAGVTTFSALNGLTAGYNVAVTATTDRLQAYDASGLINQTAPANSVTSISVACHGKNGNNLVTKVNLGTYASQALSRAFVAAAGVSPMIGRSQATGGQSFGGTIYEVWFSTTTPSDAAFTAIQQQIKAKLGITAW